MLNANFVLSLSLQETRQAQEKWFQITNVLEMNNEIYLIFYWFVMVVGRMIFIIHYYCIIV